MDAKREAAESPGGDPGQAGHWARGCGRRIGGGRETVEAEGKSLSAIQYTLRLMAEPESIRDLPVVRVDHSGVLALLELEPEDSGRISLGAIEPHWQEVSEQAQRASQVEGGRRDLYQRSVIELHNRVNTLLSYSSMMAPYVVPPLGESNEWRPFQKAYLDSRSSGTERSGELSPVLAYYITMMTAYTEEDAEAFNRAVAGYHHLLRQEMPGALQKSVLEVLFNRASLFIGTMAVYILAFLLICASRRRAKTHPGKHWPIRISICPR